MSQTLDRLETVLKERGITVFARIDHAGEAALMVAHPSVAIDLPMKALAWQDATGKVWVGFNGADYIKTRHDLTDEQAKSLAVVGVLIDTALK
jgi:uncharacterized protein (DUF302 family)